MKTSLFLHKFLAISYFTLLSFCINAQIQIGENLNGDFELDKFGSKVTLSCDGKRLVISAPDNSEAANQAGKVKVFERNDDFEWVQLGSDLFGETFDDTFGSSIALSCHGNRLIVGLLNDDDGGFNSGSAIIYEWDGSDWSQLGEKINGAADYDVLGISVSIANDGNRVAVGAPSSSWITNVRGYVKIFDWNGENWVQAGEQINGENIDDGFGSAIAISGNGNRIVIGAAFNDDNGSAAGTVSIFEWTGSAWIKLGENINGDNIDDRAGTSVAITDTGNRIAIGAYLNDEGGSDAGQVKVYDWNGDSWIQTANSLLGEASVDLFGRSVALNATGDKVAIGATRNDDNGDDAGHVRIFELSDNEWVQSGNTLVGEAENDNLGNAVALSANGLYAALGAPGNDDTGNSAGQVKVYYLNCPTTGFLSAVSCENYTAPSGNLLTDSGIYLDTIANTFGCDSIITIDLTLNQSTVNQLTEMSCDSFSLNDEVYNESGTYTQVLTNAQGCDSLITLDLVITNIDTMVIEADNTLMSTAVDASYQWIDCNTGQAIIEATNATFVPSQSGDYAVSVSQNGCTGLSACYHVVVTSIYDNNFPTVVELFPNPASEQVQISFGDNYPQIELTIYDIRGRSVLQKIITNQEKATLNFSKYISGAYYIKLKSGINYQVLKLFKI